MLEKVAEPDPPGTEWMLDSLEGDLVFDVGANVGQSMLRLGHIGKVVCFEPCEASYDVLVEQLLPNAVAMEVAITDADGSVTLVEQAGHIARGQLTTPGTVEPPDDEHGWGRQVGERIVTGRTITSMADTFGVPDAIKVDVEGHEVRVVEGARGLLEDGYRPEWLIEFHSQELLERCMLVLGEFYDDMQIVRHPHYAKESWGWRNHGWLLT